MKISCTPISMSRAFSSKEMNLQSFIEFCAQIGLDGIDLMDSRRYAWQWNDKDTEFAQVGKWLKDAGLELAACASGNNFAVRDEEKFQDNVNTVKLSLREAAELGAPVLRIFGGHHIGCGGELNTVEGFPKVLRGIEECLPDAEKCGVVLALENHGRLPGHSWEMNKIMDYFKSDYLKVTMDIGNFLAFNMDELEDPCRAYDNLRGKIAHVHAKDWIKAMNDGGRRCEGWVLGKGSIGEKVPLRQVCAMLEEDKYAGFVSLEFEGGHSISEREGVKRSLEYLCMIRDSIKALSR